ncbi:hypothetical protein ACFE04_027562 [Oxalis oulophora]
MASDDVASMGTLQSFSPPSFGGLGSAFFTWFSVPLILSDDTSIPTDIKLPILYDFHNHIYDPHWHFSCGTKEYKVLMDQFHHVSTAFLELDQSYQKAIEDITMRMGGGMAKFICKEVETVDDYDEYCHYVAGLVGLGLSKLFHAAKLEDLASDFFSNSMGWDMAPYIEAIDSQQSSYFILRCFCDILRVRWEKMCGRTKERALLKMEKLVEGVSKNSPPVAEMIRLCYVVNMPTIPAFRKEYGQLLASCGLIGEALTIFESLELWGILIHCNW